MMTNVSRQLQATRRMRGRGAALAGSLLAVCVPAASLAQDPSAGAPGPQPLPAAGSPIVFVNSALILPVAPGADSADAALQQVGLNFQEELAAEAAAIDSMIAAYQQQQALMAPAARQQREQEIANRRDAAIQRQQALNVEFDNQRAQLLAPILDRVNLVIEEIRAEQGYAVVLDAAQAGFIAADPTLDMTEHVLVRLGVDLAALAAPPATPAPGAPPPGD